MEYRLNIFDLIKCWDSDNHPCQIMIGGKDVSKFISTGLWIIAGVLYFEAITQLRILSYS